MSKNKVSEMASAAVGTLRALAPVGTNITAIRRYEGASGTSRVVQFLAPVNGVITDISESVGAALGFRKHSKHPGVVVQGLIFNPESVVASLADTVHGDRNALSVTEL